MVCYATSIAFVLATPASSVMQFVIDTDGINSVSENLNEKRKLNRRAASEVMRPTGRQICLTGTGFVLVIDVVFSRCEPVDKSP